MRSLEEHVGGGTANFRLFFFFRKEKKPPPHDKICGTARGLGKSDDVFHSLQQTSISIFCEVEKLQVQNRSMKMYSQVQELDAVGKQKCEIQSEIRNGHRCSYL